MMILDFTNGEFWKPPKRLRFVPQTTARKGRRTFRILQLWRESTARVLPALPFVQNPKPLKPAGIITPRG